MSRIGNFFVCFHFIDSVSLVLSRWCFFKLFYEETTLWNNSLFWLKKIIVFNDLTINFFIENHHGHLSIVVNVKDWVFNDYGLTDWGRMAHICVSTLAIIGLDNGLSPGCRQAIIWGNIEILLIRTLGAKFSEILSKIHTFSFKKCLWKWRLQKGGLGLNMGPFANLQ